MDGGRPVRLCQAAMESGLLVHHWAFFI